MRSSLPLVFGFVLSFAFLLMLFAFRSIVIAIKAIVLNLLSVAAAYGVLVLVFQHGWGKGLLGFESTGGIDPIMPILLFVILFGLSMDYHVFVLSRIRELSTAGEHGRGDPARDQVHRGRGHQRRGRHGRRVLDLRDAVDACSSSSSASGLAVAILIDATIIRAVLLPATMKLLGEWNWYLPRWLQWIPGGSGETGLEDIEPATEPRTSTPTRG